MAKAGDVRARLEAEVAADPGARVFPALADLYRRAGHLDEALRVARDGLEADSGSRDGRLVLALALVDAGRLLEARQELEHIADLVCSGLGIAPRAAAAAEEPVSEAEIDDAFDMAETDTDELIDPNRVAEEAVARADGGAVGLVESGPGEGFAAGPTFATRTMAELLERQGDLEGAERIRRALDTAPAREQLEPSGRAPTGSDQRDALVVQLERWLANARHLREMPR